MSDDEADWPPGVPVSRIEIVEYLDGETGDYLIGERYWTADGVGMPYWKKIGLLEGAKITACIPMIQSAPDMTCDEES